jgi:hypothetical protein
MILLQKICSDIMPDDEGQAYLYADVLSIATISAFEFF